MSSGVRVGGAVQDSGNLSMDMGRARLRILCGFEIAGVHINDMGNLDTLSVPVIF